MKFTMYQITTGTLRVGDYLICEGVNIPLKVKDIKLNMKYCDVINDGDIHKVVCKCCGHSHIESNSYINPYNDEEWIEF